MAFPKSTLKTGEKVTLFTKFLYSFKRVDRQEANVPAVETAATKARNLPAEVSNRH
jgi:hypothetical protein